MFSESKIMTKKKKKKKIKMHKVENLIYISKITKKKKKKKTLTLPPVAALLALSHFSCSRRVGTSFHLGDLRPPVWGKSNF
jgi:hypothetical protein